jgi:hypothetical protein
VSGQQATGVDFANFRIATVAGRRIFYNGSAWDGNNAAAAANDDGAIAPDKQALLPGQTAGFANYTSYVRGINGVMVDIAQLPGTPTAADFAVRVGNDNSPTSWAAGPPPSSVTVRPGAGIGGSDRVTLIWPDGAISKTWLQVTVLATARTGLLSPDVFYFGNAIGEVGNTTVNAIVSAADEALIRLNPRSIFNLAPIDFRYDINRDKQVTSADQALSRVNQTSAFSALRLIAPPANAAGGTAATADERRSALDAALADASDALSTMGQGALSNRATQSRARRPVRVHDA